MSSVRLTLTPSRRAPAGRPGPCSRSATCPSTTSSTAAPSARSTRSASTCAPGEFLGIVGESGCGKSTLLFAIAQLLAPPAGITGGSVTFKGANLVGLTDSQLTAVRWRDLSVVMQSAMNALNPVKSIGAQFKDAMRAHGGDVEGRDRRPGRPRCSRWSASTRCT